MSISEDIIKPKSSTHSKIKGYLDSLSIKEIKVLTSVKIAELLHVDKGTAGMYLYEYRTIKDITLLTTKQTVFDYLESLSREEFTHITNTTLAKKIKINKNSASSYLTQYRKSLKQKTYHKTKSLMKTIFEFMDENPKKRLAIKIAKEFPDIENELISSYVYRWYRLHPELRMEKYAMGIAKLRNWSEEELDYLRENKYNSYCKEMKKLGRIPKPSKDQPTMKYFEEIKGGLSKKEITEFTQEKALEISSDNAIILLGGVANKFSEIDFDLTQTMVIELKNRINKIGKDRPATTIVGTAIYLANRNISPYKTNIIMDTFGKCSRASINQLCEILRIRKKITEDVEVSLNLLKKIAKEYSEIDYKKTEKAIKKIKLELVKSKLDRPVPTVVGTAIYMANKDLTQARTNEIMVNITNCRPMNLTRLLKLLDM